MPFSRHRGQFGEGVYDEVILAATTLASTKTGALIVIERNVGLKNVTDGGVQLDAELSYDLLIEYFQHCESVTRRRGRRATSSHRSRFVLSAVDTQSASLARSRHTPSRGDRCY